MSPTAPHRLPPPQCVPRAGWGSQGDAPPSPSLGVVQRQDPYEGGCRVLRGRGVHPWVRDPPPLGCTRAGWGSQDPHGDRRDVVAEGMSPRIWGQMPRPCPHAGRISWVPFVLGGRWGVEYPPPPPPQGLTLFAATPALVLGGRRRMVGPSCSFIAQECSRINPWGAGGGGGMEERGGSSIPPRGPHWLGTSGRTVALDHRRSS